MRILIIANHYLCASARYATAAFQRLGHDVRHVGPAMGRRIWGLDLPPGSEWTPDGTCTDHVDWADLVLVMDTDPEMLDAGAYASNRGKPVSVWTVDNHVRDVRRPYFQHYFLAHRNVSVMDWITLRPGWGGAFVELEYIDMTHLPCCYDPTIHTPSPIAYEDRAYDVAMIGVMYPQRWALVKELRAAGLKVLAGTGLVGESYRDAYHNARISLCMSSNHDVAQRVYETAAMGCVVMSDDCPDFGILNPDGIWIYKPENIVKDVQAILEQPEVAKESIRRSMEWSKPHTWDARCNQILTWFEREYKVDTVRTERV